MLKLKEPIVKPRRERGWDIRVSTSPNIVFIQTKGGFEFVSGHEHPIAKKILSIIRS